MQVIDQILAPKSHVLRDGPFTVPEWIEIERYPAVVSVAPQRRDETSKVHAAGSELLVQIVSGMLFLARRGALPSRFRGTVLHEYIFKMNVADSRKPIVHKLDRIGTAEAQVRGISNYIDAPRVGQVHNALHFGLVRIDQRPIMRMEGKLDTGLHATSADFIEGFRKDAHFFRRPPVRYRMGAQVSPSEIDFQHAAAANGDVVSCQTDIVRHGGANRFGVVRIIVFSSAPVIRTGNLVLIHAVLQLHRAAAALFQLQGGFHALKAVIRNRLEGGVGLTLEVPEHARRAGPTELISGHGLSSPKGRSRPYTRLEKIAAVQNWNSPWCIDFTE